MKKLALSLVVIVAGACSTAPGSPVAPAALTSVTAAGPSGETLKVTAPQLLLPAAGAIEDDLDPDFLWTNVQAKYAPAQPFTYDFEILGPAGNVLQALNVPQGGSTTGLEISIRLDMATDYTWRTRARLGSAVGPWSTSAFKTFTRFTCTHLGNDPLAIIGCHRNRFPGTLGHAELFEMMKDIAWDFNQVGVPGGPYGRLVKQSGNNCGGYSCDIICTGQGNNQIQYDILMDESIPVWTGGGNDIYDGIRPDVCEIE